MKKNTLFNVTVWCAIEHVINYLLFPRPILCLLHRAEVSPAPGVSQVCYDIFPGDDFRKKASTHRHSALKPRIRPCCCYFYPALYISTTASIGTKRQGALLEVVPVTKDF